MPGVSEAPLEQEEIEEFESLFNAALSDAERQIANEFPFNAFLDAAIMLDSG